MLKTLVLETSTDLGVVGVCAGDGARAGGETLGGRRHGRDLIPLIKAKLGHLGLAIRDLELIGIGLGPGSYTGLRIGVTAAKIMAYAAGATIVGFDSLEAVAQNAPAEAREVAVIGDAQGDDLYVAEFRRVETGAPLVAQGPSRVQSIASWLDRRAAGQIVLGPALESPRIRALMPPDLECLGPEFHRPRWEAVLELALALHVRGVLNDPWTLEPDYLRHSSAEEKHRARQAAAPTPGIE